MGVALPFSQVEKDLIAETGAKASDFGRCALANAADVEAASAYLGTEMG